MCHTNSLPTPVASLQRRLVLLLSKPRQFGMKEASDRICEDDLRWWWMQQQVTPRSSTMQPPSDGGGGCFGRVQRASSTFGAAWFVARLPATHGPQPAASIISMGVIAVMGWSIQKETNPTHFLLGGSAKDIGACVDACRSRKIRRVVVLAKAMQVTIGCGERPLEYQDRNMERPGTESGPKFPDTWAGRN